MLKSIKNIFRKQKLDPRRWISVDRASIWVGMASNGFSDYDISCSLIKGKADARVMLEKNGMRQIDLKPKSSETRFKVNITQLNTETKKVRENKVYYLRLLKDETSKALEMNQWGEALVRWV